MKDNAYELQLRGEIEVKVRDYIYTDIHGVILYIVIL